MDVCVTDARAQLIDLVRRFVRRAEAGEDIVLTRCGEPTVRLVPVRAAAGIRARKKQVLEAALRFGRENAHLQTGLPNAARNQDFVYDGDGMPAGNSEMGGDAA